LELCRANPLNSSKAAIQSAGTAGMLKHVWTLVFITNYVSSKDFSADCLSSQKLDSAKALSTEQLSCSAIIALLDWNGTCFA